MDALQLEQALKALNERLSRIEAVLKIAPPATPAPPPAQPQTAAAAVPPERPRPTQPPLQSPPSLLHGNWLGIIAVVCFVVAAAFIVKLSIDSGWLTPLRQAGLAALLGFGLIGGGLALRRADRGYAALLPGAGIVILYLTVFAAHRYYALIPFDSALAAVTLVSALCIWLYTEIRHDFYAFTAAAGAYLSPMVLDFHAVTDFSLYYFLLCSVAFATISVWVRSRVLTVTAAYLAIFVSGIVGLGLKEDLFVAEMMALHFAVFAVGSYFHTAHTRQPLSRAEAQGFLPVLLIFYALEYYFIDRVMPGGAPWLALGFAALLVGLYFLVKTKFDQSRHSQALLLALATVVIFHAGYLELMPAALRPFLLAAILLGMAASRFTPDLGGNDNPFLLPKLALFAIAAIEYLSILKNLSSGGVVPLLAALLGLAGLWAAIIRHRGAAAGQLLLGCAHILALLAFYRLASDAGSLAVSAVWLLYGAGVMGLAFACKDEFMAKSALMVLVFAAGKALLYNAASAPTIVRILCLLLTGAVLYGCGFLMRRLSAWTSDARPQSEPGSPWG